MSLTSPATIDHEPAEDVTPVRLDAASLDSTAPASLLECKRDLAADGLAPVALVLETCFDADCSLSTQEEVDRVRQHVRAASFLGAGRLEVHVESVSDEAATVQALSACAERATREGVRLEIEGPIDLDD